MFNRVLMPTLSSTHLRDLSSQANIASIPKISTTSRFISCGFNLEGKHTSKIKDIQLFPLFLRHPESGKLLGNTSIRP